jgi:hypothetical protein
MKKYLEFEEFKTDRKEKLYYRVKEDNFSFLGWIEKIIGKYFFIGKDGEKFNSNCLREIANKLDKLNKEHKGEK